MGVLPIEMSAFVPIATADGSHVLPALRHATAGSHQAVEDALALLGPDLSPQRLRAVIVRLAAFWGAAEGGLDRWALAWPADAARVQWSARQRQRLFHDDAARLGASPASLRARGPALPAVGDTAAALGRLYVLEGSSLGGQVINRGLAQRPPGDPLAGVQLRGLAPYGDATAAMWRSFRRCTTEWVGVGAGVGARLDAVVAGAVQTFAALEQWCVPLGGPG